MSTYAYIGCRTTKERNAHGKGIHVFEVLPDETWNSVQMMAAGNNPSYLCFDRTGQFLYAIHGDFSEISSFEVSRNGTLHFLNTVSTGGTNPVHLCVEPGNHWVYVANLQSGTVAVLPRLADGSLGIVKELYSLPGKEEGTVSHPHQVQLDPTGTYLAVSCQGRKTGFGQVNLFRIHAEDGTLKSTCTVHSREIAEPRHFVFHPNCRWGYGVNEKDYSVTFYHFDPIEGTLEAKQILPTLPDTYTGDGWASGIVMMPDGKHIAISNRKHNSITSFAINPVTGTLRYCDCAKTGGRQPRFITITPRGTILAANETTDTLTELAMNPVDGILTQTNWKLETESPVCVVFNKP
ncbi:lactonase family protein [Caproicibacterium sp. NSD3]